MILINLLPEHLRPIQRTPLPYIVSIAVAAAVIVGIAMVFMAQQAKLSSLQSKLADDKQALASLKDIVDESNRLTEQKLSLQSRIETIQAILSNRIVWSEQLHRLTTLTPDNMWFRNLAVVMESGYEHVPDIDPKTNQPIIDKRTNEVRMKRIRTQKPVLQVSGYVINDEQGRSEVFPLMQATSDDDEFSENFTLQSPQFEDTEFNGYPVRGFTLPFLVSTGGNN